MEGTQGKYIFKSRGVGKSTKYYTIFRHEFQPVFPFKMQLTRQSKLENFFVKLFHLQDIQVGNKQFDDTFRIQTSQKDINLLKSFFQNSTLQAGLRFWRYFSYSSDC